ncbi:hypothetical protein N665_0886s0003 [Sinapis alba]|nr:hypothetical protein N665_0886s0003 [Sinapis alba]
MIPHPMKKSPSPAGRFSRYGPPHLQTLQRTQRHPKTYERRSPGKLFGKRSSPCPMNPAQDPLATGQTADGFCRAIDLRTKLNLRVPDIREKLKRRRPNQVRERLLLEVVTTKKWPSTPEPSPQIVFSAEDAVGVHMPHNDSLLVEVGIGDCTVTKVLVDTGSSVDLIFKNTLVKMGINLGDMKPSALSLTGFNGSSETMLGTIRLRVYAHSVPKNVKFSVIDVRAPYNAILGTPWIHAMRAIPSTYHQCVKFPGNDNRIVTLRGDQTATRDLHVAEIKSQQAVVHVNTIAKPAQNIYPLQEEILEVAIDDKDPKKTV